MMSNPIRNTLKLKGVPSPREVHEYFHRSPYPEVTPIPTTWSAYKASLTDPGPVRTATEAELTKYNAIIADKGEGAAREWLNAEWADD